MTDSAAVPDILPDPPSSFNVESSLSKALLKMSFGDRNEIEEEIHGVRCMAVDETPELVQRALDEFDSRLNDRKENDPGLTVLRNVVRISKNHSGSTTSTSECYLNHPELRIRFLRKDFFVVDKAVETFVGFLQFNSELFGDFVAERPIRRSDFTSKENTDLKRSRTQLLPFRDRSGRRILVSLGIINYHMSYRTMLKILVYLQWVVSRDVETQRKGIVLHTYTYDEEGYSWEKDLRPKLKQSNTNKRERMMRSMPVRIAANHTYWKDSTSSRLLSTVYFYNMPPERRKRTKMHFGERTEILYKMASFGVPVDVLPITFSGSPKFSNHCAWLDAIEMMETSATAPLGSGDREIVDCPCVGDVVFRQGATSKYNPGNVYYMEIVKALIEEHLLGDSKKKYEITTLVYDAIVRGVRGNNGRFLEWWDKGKTWVVIKDSKVLRKKIAKTFKGYKHRNKRELPPQKLDETVEIASSIVDKESKSEGQSSVSALQEYYSKAHPSKRHKTSDLACFGIRGDNGQNDSCFGRNFFRIDG